MSETENSGSTLDPTVGRLLDIVQNLAREYQALAATIGGDKRVPKDLRRAALERGREILEKLPAALDYATGVDTEGGTKRDNET